MKGNAYALFTDGKLTMLTCDFETISQGTGFPLLQSELLTSRTWVATELKGKSTADKIALFCMLYLQHKGTAYRTTKQERANIKHVTVNELLLNTYFKATQYPLTGLKSVSDYIRHYNQVRDLATNGQPVRQKFPDHYDREYEKMIADDVSKLQRYWAHLRSLGWSKVDGVWKQVAVVIILLLLTGCAYRPKPTKPQNLKPRKYDREYIDWLNAEYPLKEVTGTKKRRKQ